MPLDKTEVLKQALAEIKALARQLKGDGMKAKYGPQMDAPADPEPGEGTAEEEAIDATEGGDPALTGDEMPPEEAGGSMMDEDKIAQLVAMLGKK